MASDANTIREALMSSLQHTGVGYPHDEYDAALAALVAERDEARRLLREVVKADQQDAQMGYPIPGDSCMGAFIGLVLMEYLDGIAAPAKEDTDE